MSRSARLNGDGSFLVQGTVPFRFRGRFLFGSASFWFTGSPADDENRFECCQKCCPKQPGVVRSETFTGRPGLVRKVSEATFSVGDMDSTGTVTVNEFTAGVAGLLDHLDPHSAVLLADREQLGVVADLLGVQNRLAGALAHVLQTVEATEAAMTAHGTSTVTWLAAELRYTRREASP